MTLPATLPFMLREAAPSDPPTSRTVYVIASDRTITVVGERTITA